MSCVTTRSRPTSPTWHDAHIFDLTAGSRRSYMPKLSRLSAAVRETHWSCWNPWACTQRFAGPWHATHVTPSADVAYCGPLSVDACAGAWQFRHRESLVTS